MEKKIEIVKSGKASNTGLSIEQLADAIEHHKKVKEALQLAYGVIHENMVMLENEYLEKSPDNETEMIS